MRLLAAGSVSPQVLGGLGSIKHEDPTGSEPFDLKNNPSLCVRTIISSELFSLSQPFKISFQWAVKETFSFLHLFKLMSVKIKYLKI